MSLFSGMRLADSSSDKSVSEKASSKNEAEMKMKDALEKDNGTSNFSFIPNTDGHQKKTDAATSGNANTSEMDDVCSGSTTNPDLSEDDPSAGDDKLTFDLDPIKVSKVDKFSGEKHPAQDLDLKDLQDLDFSVLLSLDADKTLTQDEEPALAADSASHSSFSFISKDQYPVPQVLPVPQVQDSAEEKPEDSQSVPDVHSAQDVTELFKDKPITSEENPETAREDVELILKQRLQGCVWNHTKKLGHIQKSIRELTSCVSQITEECILNGQDIVSKQQCLQALKEIQQQAIDAEDYEKAEELHIQRQNLETKISTDNSPLPCNHSALRGHLAELEELHEQERVARQEITEKYQELISEQKKTVAAARRQCSDVKNSNLGKVQKERDNLDKDQGHLEVDKERLNKQELQLEERISERTAGFRQARDQLITDRKQIQEEIQTLEAKLAALRCQEFEISDSIKEKDQEIEAATEGFDDERLAIAQKKKLIEAAETDLRKIEEELDDEERKAIAQIAEVKEIMAREDKRLLELEESLGEEEAVISDLTHRDSKLTIPWFEETFSENTKHLLKKNAAKHKMTDVQEATVELLQSQSRLLTLRQKVSDVEGLIAALSEAKQLAVSGQNFPEAKRLTDEIKRLTLEGQYAQDEIEELSKRNEDASKMVTKLREDSERLQEEAVEEEKSVELSRKNKLLEYITILKEKLHVQDTTTDSLLQTVQSAELASSLLQVKFLCLKHQEPPPDNLEELIDDCLISGDRKTAKGHQITEEGNKEESSMGKEKLETKLLEAVDPEDLSHS